MVRYTYFIIVLLRPGKCSSRSRSTHFRTLAYASSVRERMQHQMTFLYKIFIAIKYSEDRAHPSKPTARSKLIIKHTRLASPSSQTNFIHARRSAIFTAGHNNIYICGILCFERSTKIKITRDTRTANVTLRSTHASFPLRTVSS